jgi:hypothetical protein
VGPAGVLYVHPAGDRPNVRCASTAADAAAIDGRRRRAPASGHQPFRLKPPEPPAGRPMRPDSRFAHCRRHQPDAIAVPVPRADSLAWAPSPLLCAAAPCYGSRLQGEPDEPALRHASPVELHVSARHASRRGDGIRMRRCLHYGRTRTSYPATSAPAKLRRGYIRGPAMYLLLRSECRTTRCVESALYIPDAVRKSHVESITSPHGRPKFP